MLFVVLCPGTPEGSTGSGSGFKASQKTGQRLKVSSERLGEAGNRTCDPWCVEKICYRSLNFMKFGVHILNIYGKFFMLKWYLDKDRNMLKF